MRSGDVLMMSLGALRDSRLRTFFMILAMAIGVASVVVLTGLGEGARRYVVEQFSSLGTNLLIVLPGRSETAGVGPSTFIGQTPRELTLPDAMALERFPWVLRVAPIVVGEAVVSFQGLARDAPLIGSTAELLQVRHWKMECGRFLPPGDPETMLSVCVIGNKVKSELFGLKPAIGETVRVGDRRCRVIGVIASEGRSIGVDVDELVIVPVALAQGLFNTSGLFRVLVEAKEREAIPRVREFVLDTIKKRHQGKEDITVLTQDAVLSTFDRILRTLTLAVAGIAAISLGVAGILTMNVMLIAVSKRTMEVGLLKALGASQGNILILFLVEAAMLSMAGACLGLLAGEAGVRLVTWIYPNIPVTVPLWALLASTAVALATGLSFGVLPAYKASRLDPVQALLRR